MTHSSRERAGPPWEPFTPLRNGPCLCGSGLKFKKCCADRLPGTQHLGVQTRKALEEGRNKDALYLCRADITQYTIWHKSHTEPAIRLGALALAPLLQIDINALADLVDTLFRCYVKNDLTSEFPATLERLRTNVADARWQRKVTYFQALHALWPDWNEDAGRRELRKLDPVTDDNDVEILELYLDLFDEELSFSEKLQLVDRILGLAEDATDRLHYRGYKGVLYLVIGDQRTAETELAAAVSDFRSANAQEDLTNYQRYRLALSLDLLGSIRRDDALLTEAVDLYRQALQGDDLTPHGRADLLRHLGDAYRHKSAWELARESYLRAEEAQPAAINKVFICDCLLRLNRPNEAAVEVRGIDPAELKPAERTDYAFVTAAIAVEANDHGLLEKAKELLKALSLADPYFREQRDSLLLNVIEAQASGASQAIIQKTRRLLATMVRSASSYLILKPSFMGIGVDVGKVLEDLTKGEQTHSQEQRKKATDKAAPETTKTLK